MRFTKLHGTGNDFLVMDARGIERDWPALARAACDRHFGAGADGLILAAPSQHADVRMRIFNADGSEAEISGNGLRCLAKFAVDGGIVTPRGGELDVETGNGVLRVHVETGGGKVVRVSNSMGRPRLDPRDVPVAIESAGPVLRHEMQVDGRAVTFAAVSMGNPHAIHVQDAPVADFPLYAIGPLVEHHPLFPHRTNFEVIRMLGRDRAEMRVWERGVGETLSCGSGASAAIVALRLLGLVDGRLSLAVPGGVLDLVWDGEGDVILAGPVEEVFRGEWPD
ncbi:MAG: diaminopimelate epimerase [Dehalococcoidia bacterium]